MLDGTYIDDVMFSVVPACTIRACVLAEFPKEKEPQVILAPVTIVVTVATGLKVPVIVRGEVRVRVMPLFEVEILLNVIPLVFKVHEVDRNNVLPA